MSSRSESLLAMACVLVALAFVVCNSQRCDGDERPHPRGLCGRRLAQAHSNLCFLLREVYHREHYHSTKRSPRLDTSTRGLVQKIYSIPLDVLADLDLSKDNWHLLLTKKSIDMNRDSRFFPEDFVERENEKRNHHGMNAFSRRIARFLRDKAASNDINQFPSSSRNKRTAPSSNMVCDCCYNRCSPEELGTYC
ncbi:insulin-like peptide ii [Plakobranchus ocellatus]|uniref:Insulin-like peptide ii n=1 Tax=Plakobranchus ocellatus TaxID=259542 RepID=A0AAV3YEA4_9GAST|nr:insulin-like peptide ii [Plakobranchus ocellatus]